MRHTKNSERNTVLFINIIFKSLLDSIKSKFNNKSIVIKIGVANLYAGVKIIQNLNPTTYKYKYFNLSIFFFKKNNNLIINKENKKFNR